MDSIDVKPMPNRLYGRQVARPLRARQKYLLETILPRLRLTLAECDHPLGAFPADVKHLALEIGFGGGEHPHSLMQAYPKTGVIASEVFVNGLCSFLSKLYPPSKLEPFLPPPNLKIWDGDVRNLLPHLPEGVLDSVYLLFPDPWPKKRHAKRRFMHPQNVKELARLVKPGGKWFVASDDPTYQAWVEEVMSQQSWFDDVFACDVRPDGCFPTRYEKKAIKAGRRPLYWVFRRHA